MDKDRHLSASDRAQEREKKRRAVRIILSVLIFIMIVVVTAEITILKKMTTVDRRFSRGVERGVAEGWETGRSDLQLSEQGMVTDTAFIDKEYEAVADFRNKPYQDRDLRKLARRYIDDLKMCRAAAQTHDPASENEDFWTEFSGPYTDRLILLREFYTGNYKMGSSWDSYPELRDEMLLRGWAAEMAEAIRFEKTEGEDGINKYFARIKNDSGVDIAYLNIDVVLYDSNDDPVETAEIIKEDVRNGSEAELVFYYSGKDVSSYRAAYVDCVPEISEYDQE